MTLKNLARRTVGISLVNVCGDMDETKCNKCKIQKN